LYSRKKQGGLLFCYQEVFDFFVSLLQTILSVEKEDGSLTPDIVNSRVFGDILMFMWDDLVAAEVTAEQCVRLFTEIVNVTECPKPVVDGTHAFICLVVANCSRVTYGDSEFYGIGFKYNGNPQAAHRMAPNANFAHGVYNFLSNEQTANSDIGTPELVLSAWQHLCLTVTLPTIPQRVIAMAAEFCSTRFNGRSVHTTSDLPNGTHRWAEGEPSGAKHPGTGGPSPD